MISKKEVMDLPIGYELQHRFATNADGTPERWRINGKVQTWKTRQDDFKVPIKRGLREHSYVTQNEMHHFCLTVEEVAKEKAFAILRDLPFTRKPSIWANVDKVVGLSTFNEYLSCLETYTVEQVYQQSLLPHPGVCFVEIPKDYIFILVVENENGRQSYLVNSEGYEYPRYIAKIQ